MKLLTCAIPGLLCVLAIGCLGSNPTETTEIEAPVATEAGKGEVKSAAAAIAVSVEICSWSEFQEWVGKQTGKVVVIDVWSTSCGECVKEFPHFVELHDRLGDKIACASFNIDFYGVGSPEELKPGVLEFLSERNATSSNFVSSTADEEVLDALDVASIPAALVYDQSGLLKKTFKNDNEDYGAGGFNYEEHVNPLVEELLKPAG
ncbi:MAG: TlpA disulfide reductase family protein [Planctomycetota bacterium]|nr:TlpA disulfide reductase family protein [Planctomycetota bacterium]MDA1251565.1 TlpA disulfide reductase family protein [Planctomycetota bacterium]